MKKVYGIHKIYYACGDECEDFIMNTVWEDETDAVNQAYKDALEYLAAFNVQNYTSIEDAKEKQKNEPYQIDIDSNYTVIVRYWDGNNYEIIAIFDVEEFDLMEKGL